MGEDGGEGGVGEEGDVRVEVEFVGEEAEVVDAGGVVGVADGADEEEVWLLFITVLAGGGGGGGRGGR